jgi:putative ABC transport system permease protein
MKAWVARLAGLFRGRRRADELVEEIDTHLAMMAEELERRGESPERSRLLARRAFGGVDKTRVAYREQFGVPLIDAFVQDVRFALRLLARERGFAVTAVVVLGVGIGVNNMMFTLIYGSTMRGLPIPERDRVLHVSTFDRQSTDRLLSSPEFEALRTNATMLEGVAAYMNAPVAVSDHGRVADRFDATYLTANAFSAVRTAPVLGRGFVESDDRPGAAPVVILGATAFRVRYNADPTIIGRSILIDGTPSTVIGVMPGPSRFPSTAEVWLPLARHPGLETQNRGARILRVFARVKDGVAVGDARAEIEAIVDRASRDAGGSEPVAPRVVPINDRFFFPPTQPTWLAFSAAGILVLIVACANAAHLMVSRTALRVREIAVRSSLGASRGRILAQVLVESFAIAALSGLVALGVSLAAVRLFRSAIPDGAMPYWLHYSMDARVLLALIVASFVAVLLVGLVPAIQASRTDANSVLKNGGRSGSPRAARRLATAFLAAEFAIAIVLLTQFVESSLGNDIEVASDATLEASTVVSASITLPSAKYPTAAARRDFYQQLFERLPGAGIAAASAASVLPLQPASAQRLQIEGSSAADPPPEVVTLTVAPRYFATLDVPLVGGRDFTDRDGLPGFEAAIVNQRFVTVHLSGENPIGQRIRLTRPNTPADAQAAPLTIVGVTGDIRQRNGRAEPVAYLPLAAAAPVTASLIVRSALDTAGITALLRREVMAIDPDLPLYRTATIAQVIEDAQWNGRVSHRLITVLTLIALLVSVVGLYAATSHSVSQRTQELGIRIALGARRPDVRRLILKQAGLQVALGLLLGIMGSMLWTSAFFSGRVDASLIRPSVFLRVCLVLTLVTLAACAVPLRRATAIDPVAALRDD